MHKKLSCLIGAVLLAGSVAMISPSLSLAQGSPSVSMVTLQTMPGQSGQQMVVLPRGKVVPLPGPGVNGGAVNIYMGSQGGYWYTDRNGQNVDLTAAVQYLQRMQGQGGGQMQTANVPQYAPQPVVNNYYNQGNGSGSGGSSSSSGSSAAGTALAAGLGAAGGAALTNALMEPNYNSGYYHGVPYGMPVYYGAHNQPYYVDHGGNNVYVNNSQDYNRNVNAQATQNNINNQHVNEINNQHANNLQQQQKWYQQQASSHSDQFNNWQKSASAGGENPFVHQDAQNSWSQRHDEANADGDKGGRFGRRNEGNGGDGDNGGGRFGRRGGDNTADGGGRGGLLGGRDGGNADGGGRGGLLGGREGGGGGRFGRRGR